MKKFLAITALMLCGVVSYAQWIGTSPGDLSTTLPVANVGIGIAAPTFKLHVVNSGIASLVAQSSVNPQEADRAVGFFRMVNSANNETYNIAYRKLGGVFQCLQSANVAGATVNISLFDYSAKSLMFGGNGLTDIKFSNSGYVGIGTTIAPPTGVKLAVNGKINCKEIEVTLTGWADHVFNQDYKLRSLYDVENFISQNKHLPDVPSENEVLTNGSNLGQMDAVLLQKIEELTLYMIDLKKENDQLKARLEKLEK
ncbi:MAG TPA: hypothetical protein PKN44_10775 [Bacteroidales bacterium]|nr:hypothetical protein [Bacteroidales bacterium]HPS51700.1 hypothetical protein [Bacteroidales bacterium]